jgi:ribonuclease T2
MRYVIAAAIAIALAVGGLMLMMEPAPLPGTAPIALPQADAPRAAAAEPTHTQYVLAVNWQPGFCEYRADREECLDQHAGRYDATHFSLHGLWPQIGEYCDVPVREIDADLEGLWGDLPEVELPAAMRTELHRVMPGTRSDLDRHEWIKHGTCHGGDMADYFGDSLVLMAALNASPVRELFAANIGARLTRAEIEAAFDAAFGAGAGERVRILCQRDGERLLIRELTIGLTGEIGAPEDFSELILSARPTDPDCNGGVVDAAGLQ